MPRDEFGGIELGTEEQDEFGGVAIAEDVGGQMMYAPQPGWLRNSSIEPPIPDERTLGERATASLAQGGIGLQQGFHGLGEQGWSLVQAAYEPIVEVGPIAITAKGPMLASSARENAAFARESALEARKRSQALEPLAQEIGGAPIMRTIGQAIPSVAPALAAGPLGVPAAIGASGAQAGGATLSEAQAVFEQAPEERRKGAFPNVEFWDAAGPAALDAIQTAAITAVAGKIFGQGIEGATTAAKLDAIKRTVGSRVKEVIGETLEEGAQQFVSDYVVGQMSYNPSMTLDQAVSNALKAAVAGGVVGAGVVGAVSQSMPALEQTEQGRQRAEEAEINRALEEQARQTALLESLPGQFQITDPRIAQLRLEGVTQSDAEALVAGRKTVKEVVEGNFKVTPSRVVGAEQGHDEAFAEGYNQAIERLNQIIQSPPVPQIQPPAGMFTAERSPYAVQQASAPISRNVLKPEVAQEGQVALPTDARSQEAAQALTKPAQAVSDVLPEQSALTPAPIPPQAATPQTVSQTEKRVIRGQTSRSRFVKETEINGPDILSWIEENMPLLSRTGAKKAWGDEKFKLNASLWDDAAPLSRPHHNVIYKATGYAPDRVAQAAFDAGVLESPDVPALWAAIRRASNRRGNVFAEQRKQEAILKAEMQELEAWQKATAKGEKRIDADELKVGDVMEVEGERVEVTAINPDTGEVTLKDGRTFGTQVVSEGKKFYVEKYVEAKETGFEPELTPALPQVPEKAGKLTGKEQEQFEELTQKLRAQREQGGPALTTQETQVYERLLSKVGQGELLSAQATPITRIQELRAKIEQLDRLRIATQNRAYESKHRRPEILAEAKAYEDEIQRTREQIRQFESPESQQQAGELFGAIATAPPLTPAATPPVALTPKSQRQIIADLAKGLNIPIRFGRLTTRKFAGYFMPRANLIGAKKAIDIPTVSHEVGHKLDQTFRLSSSPGIASELDVLGDPATPGSGSSWTPSKSRAYKMGEGVSEFVRYWMTDPPKALSMAPNTHAAFEAALSANKDFGDVMRQARDDIQTWRNSEPQARLRSQIVSGNPNKTRYTFSQLVRDLVDDLHILRLATEHGAKTAPLDPSKNAYLLARNLRGSYGMADSFVRHGAVDFNTREVSVGTSLSDALKPVSGRLSDFRDWIVAKRAQELQRQGRETGLVPADVNAVVAKFDADPVFQKAFDDLKKWNDALLKYSVDAGLVTQESADAMRRMNQDYVPFHRIFEVGAGEAPSQQVTGVGMGLNVGKPGSLRALKGSVRAIADPLETMVQNAYTLITASEKAAINLAVADMANLPDMGRWVERVAAPTEAVRVTVAKLREELEAAGADLSAVPDDLLLTFFRAGRTAPFGENIIRVVRDGKQEFYRLNRDLHDTFKALDLEDAGTLIKLLSAPAQLLRSGVVLEPSFNIANVLRDTFSAAVISKYGSLPFETTFKGFAAMLTKPKAVAEWAAAGGKNSVEAIYFDRDRLKRFLAERISKDLSPAERALIVARSPLTALRYMTSLFEEATRIGEYQIALKKLTDSGMPVGEARRLAAFESRDRQDFAKGGAKTKIIRHMAAFWNAGLQANVKLAQAFKQRPVRTTLQGLAFVTIPKLIEQALNWDDDDYWDRPQWERDLFFLIPIGKDETGHTRFLRIPTPFEVGIIFGTFPGRIAEWMKQNRPDAMEGFPKLMLKNSVPNPIPQAGQMIFEDFLSGPQGWDVWRGRTIVPDSLSDLPPDLQWTDQTSRLAKEVGSRLNYSPMKVDHIIESTTGGVGKLLTGRSDPFSRFTTRPLRVSNQPTEDFYVELERMRMQAAKARLTGEGEIPPALADFERTSKNLSEIRTAIRATDNAKEKADLQEEMFRITKELLEAYAEQE